MHYYFIVLITSVKILIENFSFLLNVDYGIADDVI